MHTWEASYLKLCQMQRPGLRLKATQATDMEHYKYNATKISTREINKCLLGCDHDMEIFSTLHTLFEGVYQW